MPTYPSIIFNTIGEWETYINQYIIPNGNNEITGDEHNNVENGAVKFVRQSPRNWNRATVIGTAGNYTATSAQCILVFKPTATGSVTLTDNIYNEWTIVNITSSDKALVGAINIFVTPSGVLSNYCPANGVLNLVKGNDNKWYQVLSGTQTGISNPPLIGIAGGGGDHDPIVGASTYQDNLLIGLGSANDGKIQATINQAIWDNYTVGGNLFDYDPLTGILTFNAETFQWYVDMTINVNRNQ